MKKLICLISIILSTQCNQKNEMGSRIGYDLITINNISFIDLLLSDFEEEEKILKDVNLNEGFSNKYLKENAFKFYLKYWENKKLFYNDNKYNLSIVTKTTETLKDNISLVYMSDFFSVIKKPATGIDELEDIQNTDDIWIFTNNTWIPLLKYRAKFQNAKIIDLNGDEKNDIVLIGGCCDTKTLNIFITNKNGTIEYIQEINLIGDAVINLKEHCNSEIIVTSYQDKNLSKNAIFNCDKNKFSLK